MVNLHVIHLIVVKLKVANLNMVNGNIGKSGQNGKCVNRNIGKFVKMVNV